LNEIAEESNTPQITIDLESPRALAADKKKVQETNTKIQQLEANPSFDHGSRESESQHKMKEIKIE